MTTTKLVGKKISPVPCLEECNKKQESKYAQPTPQMSGICRQFTVEETMNN